MPQDAPPALQDEPPALQDDCAGFDESVDEQPATAPPRSPAIAATTSAPFTLVFIASFPFRTAGSPEVTDPKPSPAPSPGAPERTILIANPLHERRIPANAAEPWNIPIRRQRDPIPVHTRDADLREHCDGPGADPGVVRDTLLSLARLNAGALRTHALAASILRPVLRRGGALRVLDLGCGAGDLGRALVREAARTGGRVESLGVDLSPEAVALARSLGTPGDGASFETGDALGPGFDPAEFDLVVSSFLLHHLPDDAAVGEALRRSARARFGFLHLDLVRSRAAWLLFGALGRPLVRRRETFEDGLSSIRRSWTVREMAAIAAAAAPGARVEVRFPWRLRVSRLSSGE